MEIRHLPTIVLRGLYRILVTGTLEKGWGGPACRAALPIETHIAESAFWLVVAATVFVVYNIPNKYKAHLKNIEADFAKTPIKKSARLFELCVASVHFIMFAQIIYYKSNILSLVNMIQPCHLILLLQGIALYSTGTTGVIITLCILPSLTGTLLAMLFPDVGGLDQFLEMDAYWLQHYLIQSVPVYLLVRRNYVALKKGSSFNVLLGIWILLFLHFSLYEVGPASTCQLPFLRVCCTVALLTATILQCSVTSLPFGLN
jgi:hypothetical protein